MRSAKIPWMEAPLFSPQLKSVWVSSATFISNTIFSCRLCQWSTCMQRSRHDYCRILWRVYCWLTTIVLFLKRWIRWQLPTWTSLCRQTTNGLCLYSRCVRVDVRVCMFPVTLQWSAVVYVHHRSLKCQYSDQNSHCSGKENYYLCSCVFRLSLISTRDLPDKESSKHAGKEKSLLVYSWFTHTLNT